MIPKHFYNLYVNLLICLGLLGCAGPSKPVPAAVPPASPSTKTSSSSLSTFKLMTGTLPADTPTLTMPTANTIFTPAPAMVSTLSERDMGATSVAQITPQAAPGKLNEKGPWLLLDQIEGGFWLANLDGSGMKSINVVHDLYQLSPDESKMAVLASLDQSSGRYQINILTLPAGKVEKSIDILFQPDESKYPDIKAQYEREIFHMAWSPDGQKLAYSAFSDGNTADIYLYKSASGEVQRVTHGEADFYDVSWSPDGQSLLMFATKDIGSFQAQYPDIPMAGIWLADGDGYNEHFLYKPFSYGDHAITWLDKSRVILASRQSQCHDVTQGQNGFGGYENVNYNLDLFDLSSNHHTTLHKDCLWNLTADDQGDLMFSDRDNGGVLFIPAGKSQAQKLLVNQTSSIRWDAIGQVFEVVLTGKGLVSYDRKGLRKLFEKDVLTNEMDILSSDGSNWMWTEVTPDRNWLLWVKKPDQPAQTIYQTKFLLFGFWNPVDGSIYFSDILKGIVYRADASQYTNPQSIIHYGGKNGPGVQIIGLKQ